VPTCALTTLTSVLLMTPLAFTSLRKLDGVTGAATWDFSAVTSVSEAQIYLALVRNGALSGSAVASVTGFPRSSVYAGLEIGSFHMDGLLFRF
jgi:hypothetical protein